MSSKVQQQEYNPNDPPLWFGYDYEGNPLTEQHEITPLKNVEWTVTESAYSSEEEVELEPQARTKKSRTW